MKRIERIEVQVKTRNAAFQAGPAELARIFRELSEAIRAERIPDSLRDFNGNVVGSVIVFHEED